MSGVILTKNIELYTKKELMLSCIPNVGHEKTMEHVITSKTSNVTKDFFVLR